LTDLGSGREDGEELRSEATFRDLSKSRGRIEIEGNGERRSSAQLVLHGANGFIEGVDDEIEGSCANDFAEMRGVMIDGKRDCACDVRSDGESRTLRSEDDHEDERSSPFGSELLKNGIGAKDPRLSLIAGYARSSERS
jgi:hypothetical protein